MYGAGCMSLQEEIDGLIYSVMYSYMSAYQIWIFFYNRG